MTVELTCESCNKTQEFPSKLEVIGDELENGWTLEIKNVENNQIIIDSVYCPDCH